MKKILVFAGFMVLTSTVHAVYEAIETLLGPAGDQVILVSDRHTEGDDKQVTAVVRSLQQYKGQDVEVFVEDGIEALAAHGLVPEHPVLNNLQGLVQFLNSNQISASTIEVRALINAAELGYVSGESAIADIDATIEKLKLSYAGYAKEKVDINADILKNYMMRVLDAMRKRDEAACADVKAGKFFSMKKLEQATMDKNAALRVLLQCDSEARDNPRDPSKAATAQQAMNNFLAKQEIFSASKALLGSLPSAIFLGAEMVDTVAATAVVVHKPRAQTNVVISGGLHYEAVKLMLTKLFSYKPLVNKFAHKYDLNSSIYRQISPQWFTEQAIAPAPAKLVPLTPQQIEDHFTESRKMLSRLPSHGCRLK